MIKMSELYNHSDYEATLVIFNNSAKSRGIWSIFKNVHMLVSKGKCPICECILDGSLTRSSNNNVSTSLVPTIDHYRPKDPNLYPNLEYDHKNYILMCSDCNNAYKGNQFPLHLNSNRNTGALNTSQIVDEFPLIVNPIVDNLDHLFRVVLKYTTSGKKVLELEAIGTDAYLKEKAVETIRVFSLGNCEDVTHMHSSVNVQNCRIDLLSHHFTKFYSITSIMRGRRLEDLEVSEQKEIYKEVKHLKLMDYGFFEFIMKGSYVDLVTVPARL